MAIDDAGKTSTSRPPTLRLTVAGGGKGVYHEAQGHDPLRILRFEGDRAFGGNDRAPSPLDYMLGALGACLQITASVVARQKGLLIGRFRVRTDADYDNRALVWGVLNAPPFRHVRMHVDVETTMTTDVFSEFADEVQARCPIHQLFVASETPLHSEWHATAMP